MKSDKQVINTALLCVVSVFDRNYLATMLLNILLLLWSINIQQGKPIV